MVGWTARGLAATVIALTVSLSATSGVQAVPKPRPAFSPMIQGLGESSNGYLPVGQHWVDVPAAYKKAVEAAYAAGSGEQVAYRFHCPDGYALGRAKKAGEPWTAATTDAGYVRSRWTYKKGALVCTQPANLKTSFPAWFPTAHPSVADIRRLGQEWGPSTPVAVGLQIPMPDLATCVPAVLPDGRLTELRSTTPYTADWADGIEGNADASWTFSGGSGLMYQGPMHIGHPAPHNYPEYQGVRYYALAPGKSFTVADSRSSVYSAGNVYDPAQQRSYDAWYIGWDFSAGVVPDCGQGNLPQSLVAMWDIPRTSWVDKNDYHPDEYLTMTERTLGAKDLPASPVDRTSVTPWVSTPGTADN